MQLCHNCDDCNSGIKRRGNFTSKGSPVFRRPLVVRIQTYAIRIHFQLLLFVPKASVQGHLGREQFLLKPIYIWSVKIQSKLFVKYPASFFFKLQIFAILNLPISQLSFSHSQRMHVRSVVGSDLLGVCRLESPVKQERVKDGSQKDEKRDQRMGILK